MCQRSLLRHGELHNNLRMTWGKAVPLWTESLEHSLLVGQTLNDKYALDGRDPSSVVGVQWCHGLFDRPFFPSIPVMGIVRKRDVLTHESRLDLRTYEEHIDRTSGQGMYFVIGTDITASSVARMLHDNGLEVRMVNHANQGNYASLNAVEGTLFPPWMKERVASMCERADTNTVSDIGNILREGIIMVDDVPSDGVVVYQSQDYAKDSESLAIHIEQSMWKAVGKVWEINAAVKPKGFSIQTKLI